MEPSGVRLEITNILMAERVRGIPLVNYLLLMKSERYKTMGDQEYLDREHHWDVILFLRGGRWVDTHIVVNDWDVRINIIDDL